MFTAAERYQFDVLGYIVRRQVLAPELIARLNDALARLEGRGPDELPENCVPSWTPVINEYRLMGLLEADPTFWELIDHPCFTEVADAVVPKPYRLSEAYSITRLQGLGVPLHSQPEARYRWTEQGPKSHLLKMAISLSDVGPDDGPMVVFDGSHKIDVPFPFSRIHPDWKPVGNDPEMEQAFLAENADQVKVNWEDIPGYTEVHVRAGDVIFMSDDMWHGAKGLESGKRRRTLYYSYVPYHYPNWHGIPYSKELKSKVSPSQLKLLAGPFVGTRYACHDTSEIAEDLPFPHLPNSARDLSRFAAFRNDDGDGGEDLAGPVRAALEKLTVARADENGSAPLGKARFDVSGDGGGTFSLDLSAEGARLVPGSVDAPDCVIEVAAADLAGLAEGREDPVQMFYEGRARARGDIRLAMRLADRWGG